MADSSAGATTWRLSKSNAWRAWGSVSRMRSSSACSAAVSTESQYRGKRCIRRSMLLLTVGLRLGGLGDAQFSVNAPAQGSMDARKALVKGVHGSTQTVRQIGCRQTVEIFQ